MLPGRDLGLDFEPLGVVELPEFVGLDDYVLVQLVDAAVDDVVGDCRDRPLLDLVLLQVQQFRELREGEHLACGLFDVQVADLDESLFLD